MHNGTIGAVLCSLRKQNAMTQKDLSQKLSVHITTKKTGKAETATQMRKMYVRLLICFMLQRIFCLAESRVKLFHWKVCLRVHVGNCSILYKHISIPFHVVHQIKEADESMQVDSSASFYLLVACLRLLETTLDLRARISGTVGSWHPRALALYAPKSA